MTGPIIVGVDGSDTAAQAARVAGQLARGLGVAVHCVSAYDKDTNFALAQGSEEWDVTSHDQAQELAAQAAAGQVGSGLERTWAGVVGKPADVLISEAERLEASLIVVGNRRKQGLGRVLGSVANSVAHSAPCDVHGNVRVALVPALESYREGPRTDGEQIRAKVSRRWLPSGPGITRWRSAILEEVPARPAPAEVNPAIQGVLT